MTQIQTGFDERIAPQIVAELQSALGSEFEVEIRLVKPASEKISFSITHIPLLQKQKFASPIWIGSQPVQVSEAQKPTVRSIVIKDVDGELVKVGDVRIDGRVRISEKLTEIIKPVVDKKLTRAEKQEHDFAIIEKFVAKHQDLGIIGIVSTGDGDGSSRKRVSDDGLIDVRITEDGSGLVGIKMTQISKELKQKILLAIVKAGIGEDLQIRQFDTILDEVVFTGKLDKVGQALVELSKLGLTEHDIKGTWD